RRAALDDALVPDVGPDGADDPAHVDPAMLEEATVLDVDDRVADPRRHICGVDQHPALRAAEDGEDAAPVAGVDEPVHLRPAAGGIERGNLAPDRGDEPEREGGEGEQPEDGEEREEAKLANSRALRARGMVPSAAQHEA